MKKIKITISSFLILGVLVAGLTGLAGAASAGDVVINEIAWMGTEDYYGDEWLELYNATGGNIDLTGWTIEDSAGVIADLSDTGADVMNNSTIAASGYYLIEYETSDESESAVNDVTGDFQGLDSGSLGNTGDKVILKDNAGTIIDEVDCSDGWFAGDSDARATMERRFPGQDSNDEANWGTNDMVTINGTDAGGNPIYGTPRQQNSVYATAVETMEGVLTVESSPFFPHGDNSDRTTTCSIGYMVENDAEVSIRIFNVEGNLKANILQNESVSGSASPRTKVWDGTDTGGDIVPVGIYIVHIKIVEDDTGDITTDQATAVVGRSF
jgi:hypothetical protein